MAAKSKASGNAGATPVPPALAKRLTATLAERISDSMLIGDQDFEDKERREAASFMLAAAYERVPGQPAIAIESASEAHRFMRIAIINDDMPFLVDSIATAIAGQGIGIDRLIHPVVAVERDEDARIAGLPDKSRRGDAELESMIYIETSRADARQRRALDSSIKETLGDVRAAVSDWAKMRRAMQEDATRLDSCEGEGGDLLRWLDDGMLTQLGHLTRYPDGKQDGLLGVCRKSAKELLAPESYERAFKWFEGKDACADAPLIIKSNRLSKVHRRVPLDLFIVPVIDGDAVIALSIHVGVWTSAALAAPPDRVPRIHRQLKVLNAKLGFDPRGHAGKALVHALTTLPHDIVVGFSDDDVERVATTMMTLVDRPRPRLALVEAPLARHLFAFVWLPRDLLSATVRGDIETMLSDAAQARVLDWSLEIEGGQLATLRFVLDIRDASGSPDAADLEARLETMLRGWGEAVERELAKSIEPSRAAALAARFADAFPAQYRSDLGAGEAAIDIGRLRALAAEDSATLRGVRLYCPEDVCDEKRLRLKIYQREGALPLSDAVPALENFGFRVMEEYPTPLQDGQLGTIHDFALELRPGDEVEALIERADPIEAAIAAVLNGQAEDDPFNRLVTGTGLAAQEAEWMRAFYRYLRQTGMGFTIYTVVDALGRAPAVTHALVALIRARHDPAFPGDRDKGAEAARKEIARGLAAVAAINDDRLLRLYRGAIEAILRTNAFAPAAREALAFKFESAKVPGLPKPVPWREIFVYSRRVEGIHLRAGPVARGGLRWSDRRDDFRTEILGLMKAQRVKNAVIVPTGAKGGFYPKQLPDPARDREGWAFEGQASYEIFIRSLLSITDDIDDDRIVHPDSVVIRDADDPYFVVAADKGTARFSDIANAIAAERGFWLDDAFASGGSNGYDHKAMGITARGAWISVQRHFREMGVDVQSDSVRVAGCGDMSGDVFGNGMLLSKAILLVAAFDHRHIFIDPDPDPAQSWKERQRLFELPRSSWDDYDKSLISKGGGVFARDSKSIKLTAQMRKMLCTDAKEIEPEALISAILAAPVDLLWFGGIGTYVKASSEANVQVGDPGNDALRVNGSDLRAKVIGEGANLGITQAGRIEFALRGGRINTDFIDNSAGVDCSDNEVNIKIALAAARRSGKLSAPKRNALLAEMTDEVAELVLEDNRQQALALSIAQLAGSGATASHLRLLETLEDSGGIDRLNEGLASSEHFTRRASDGEGLTRPELAVLLSSVKLALQDAIENSPLATDPALEPMLFRAFPEPMRGRFSSQIEEHRLRRELIATKLANRLVNRLGLIHPFELAEEEGADLAQIASAFVMAEALYDIGPLWERLDAAVMPEPARLHLFARLAAAMRIQMADLIRASGGSLSPSTVIEELGERVTGLVDQVGTLLAAEGRQVSARMRAELAETGAPEKLAADVARLFEVDGAVGLARLSRQAEIDPATLTGAFTDLGARLGLDWAQSTAATMIPTDPWERLLVAGLARDFQQMRFEFLRRLARRKGAKDDPGSAVEAWADENAAAIQQFRAMVGRAQAAAPVAPAMVAQIASQARNLLNR